MSGWPGSSPDDVRFSNMYDKDKGERRSCCLVLALGVISIAWLVGMTVWFLVR